MIKGLVTQVNASQALCESGRLDSNQRPPEPHSGVSAGEIAEKREHSGSNIIPPFTRIASFLQGSQGDCCKSAARFPVLAIPLPEQAEPGQLAKLSEGYRRRTA
jgi:hypothetical protein